MDDRIKKWLKWLDIIRLEIYSLVEAKDVFWEVQSLIKNNKKIQKPSVFYQYLGDTYISHAIIGIRRQIKKDIQSISFAKLLEEISQDPERISREYFVNLYKGSAVEYRADEDFDQFSGSDKNHISVAMIKNDIEALKNAAQKCEEYADKRVAHRDKTNPKGLIKFLDIDNCIEVMDSLYCKYHLILFAEWIESLKPSDLTDWMKIFDSPWRIQKDKI